MSETLLTTIGTEPQIVTIAYTVLRQRGYAIEKIVVIHTDGSQDPSQTALSRLRPTIQQLIPPPAYEEIEIEDKGRPMIDVDSELGAQATFKTIYQAAQQAKNQGETLHFCTIGGRKVMGMYGMTVAQLLFDVQDHFWYLVSYGDFLREKRMIPTVDDEVTLYKIPVVRWSGVPPNLTKLRDVSDPVQALQVAEARQERLYQQQLRMYVANALTRAERQTVAAAVQHPEFTYEELSAHLHKGIGTINTQLQSAYRKLEEALEIERVTRAVLNRILSGYPWQE